MIPSVIINNDQIIDGVSNLAVLFFFVIYGTVVLMSMINHKTNHVPEARKQKAQVVVGAISVLGCYLAAGYCIFYEFIVQVGLDPNATNVTG